MVKYYTSSLVLFFLAVAVGYMIGGLTGAWIVAILSVLETSLSFDNAVVNATVLRNWDDKWRKRFIRYGIPIAVFGMRLVFPLLIVAIVAGIGPVGVVDMALDRPDEYEATLVSVHHEIAAFGGAFLLMVFLKFFFDAHKEDHWLDWIEEPLSKIGRLEAIELAVAITTILVFSHVLPEHQQWGFIVAGMWGLVTYILADAVGSLAGGEDAAEGKKIIRAGVGGFLYLELLDASFSFDGVIAAFALSNNIFIIALGLGVGAMFVRSMTIHLVEKGTLEQFKYLEHGAFWAIGALAAIMFVGTVYHIHEAITGLIGVLFIGLSIWSSVRAKHAEEKAQAQAT